MNLTSLELQTSPVTELLSIFESDGSEFTREMDGTISTATFVIESDAATINAIKARTEIIAYVGSVEVWGGYIALISERETLDGYLRAELQCQGYEVLTDRSTVATETTYSGTDEAALDDVFANGSPATGISTTPVISVISDMKDMVAKVGETVRRVWERIIERSGAASWVTPDKTLEYGDPASDLDGAPFNLEESPTAIEYDDISSWSTAYTAYANNQLDEDDTITGYYYAYHSISLSVGVEYTFIVDAKANERGWVYLDASSGVGGYFDLTTGELGNVSGANLISARMVPLGDGVYRIFIRFTYASGSSLAIHPVPANNQANHTGVVGYGVYVYGVSLVTGKQWFQDGFSHELDASDLANDITVDRGEPSVTQTQVFYPGASGDDGHVYRQHATSWPPPTGGTPYSAGSGFFTRKGWDSGLAAYVVGVGLLRFDTSAIPAGATITETRLRLRANGASNGWGSADGMSIEYYASANWPIDGADYVFAIAQDAFAVARPTPTGDVNQWFDLQLLNPDANISKSGYTGFRLHIEHPTSPPVDQGYQNFLAYDNGEDAPELHVTWTLPPYTANVTDPTSIAAYGTQKAVIVDSTLESDDEADLMADVILAARKDPKEYGRLVVDEDGLEIGDLLHIESTTMGIDDDFVIRSIRTFWESGQCRHEIEYGDHKPNYIKLLRKLNSYASQIS